MAPSKTKLIQKNRKEVKKGVNHTNRIRPRATSAWNSKMMSLERGTS